MRANPALTRMARLVVCLLLTASLPGCGAEKSPPPSPNPVEPGGTPTSDSFRLQRVTMVDEQHGWAETGGRRQRLLRTTDSGASWTDITPEGVMGWSSQFLMDADRAWLLVPKESEGTLYSTGDGGKRWVHETVPFAWGFLFFTGTDGTEPHGWALDDRDAAMGNNRVDVYRRNPETGWALVSSGEGPGNPISPEGTLPYNGTKNSIVFSPDMTVGLITVEYRSPGQYGVYISRDGGRTWHPQQLPISPDPLEDWVRVYPPRFFSENGKMRGVIPATMSHDGATTLVYVVSDNGGKTWHAATSFRGSGPLGPESMTDSTHWWATDGTRLFRTTDGGRTWVDQAAPKGSSSLLFVAPQVGWALTSAGGEMVLSRTVDGGATWHRIYPPETE